MEGLYTCFFRCVSMVFPSGSLAVLGMTHLMAAAANFSPQLNESLCVKTEGFFFCLSQKRNPPGFLLEVRQVFIRIIEWDKAN